MQQRMVLVALFVVVAVLVGLTWRGVRGSERSTPEHGNAAASPSSEPRLPGAGTASAEVPPWHATPANTTALPPGTVPVWQVDPPPPDSSQPQPPPREPPNPAQHRPAMDNPGGVNGDRPERVAPGGEQAP